MSAWRKLDIELFETDQYPVGFPYVTKIIMDTYETVNTFRSHCGLAIAQAAIQCNIKSYKIPCFLLHSGFESIPIVESDLSYK